jgi:hypothetical protein
LTDWGHHQSFGGGEIPVKSTQKTNFLSLFNHGKCECECVEGMSKAFGRRSILLSSDAWMEAETILVKVHFMRFLFSEWWVMDMHKPLQLYT